eukprot:TRINITY_DN11819_c0_g1_i1.p1 TRINITY_DN11819_c0_g1~~TRINITY_DN11819_c0_g1_i1.p1  ORF type:complete len:228 (-),score=79.33 TRINITY_DN11819_c0_g1_i1:172-855(-)
MDPTCRSCSDYPCTCGRAIGVPIDNGPGKPWTIRAGLGADLSEMNYDDYVERERKSEEEAKIRREKESEERKIQQKRKEDEWLSDSSIVDETIATTMMWRAAKEKDFELFKSSLDRGADPTGKIGDSFKRYPKIYNVLHEVCDSGWLEAVQLLLDDKYGKREELIDSNSGNYHTQFTPLLFAVTKNHISVVKFLLEKGANKKMDDGFGKLPLAWAKEKKFTELIPLL